MSTESRPLVEINQRAIRLLYTELGVVDAVRFFRQFMPGFGDYTEERHDLFKAMTLDEVVGEIKRGTTA